jgi:hypothetical protein
MKVLALYCSVLTWVLRRDFLSMFEDETKKKKRAALKESGQHMEKLAKDVDRDQRYLKKQVEELIAIS